MSLAIIVEHQEDCINEILHRIGRAKIGPVPPGFDMTSWCDGYETCCAEVQKIIDDYIDHPRKKTRKAKR